MGFPPFDADWARIGPAARVVLKACVALYVAAQALLVLYSLHRCLLLRRRRRGPAGARPAPPPPREWPPVTVQLPVYNERRVIDRLIDAVAALDYPAGRLEIQVLDDSTDETSAWARTAAAPHAARGVDIHVIRRAHRAGFKAGALAAGLRAARGEFLAVFDSDFVPEPDFLRRAMPHFADPGVGMVQARWGHLNRDGSLLTAAQAVMLDSHFGIEHEARMRRGLFFNFNGTAGVWRRSCIESAGGWSHDTLTEDLDLSYRAQLEGWRFVYDDTIEAPAELPGDMEALKSQQRRWVKGSIQTARKLLPRLLAGGLPAAVKLEALVHLTNNLAYPLLLLLGLLLLPVLATAGRTPPAVAWVMQAGLIGLGLVPVIAFLAAGQRARGRSPGLARDVTAALLLGIGLALNNARAALAGFAGPAGEWERTPKSGEGPKSASGRGGTRRGDGKAGPECLRPPCESTVMPGPAVEAELDVARGFSPGRSFGAPRGSLYASARRLAGWSELLLAIWFAGVGAYAGWSGHWGALPMLALLSVAFASVGAGSLHASLRATRLPRSGPRRRRPGGQEAMDGWDRALWTLRALIQIDGLPRARHHASSVGGRPRPGP